MSARAINRFSSAPSPRAVIPSRLAFICLAAIACQGPAQTLYVTTNGNDALPGTSWSEAKRSIGSAITKGARGTAIWIGRGTYVEHITLKPQMQLYGGFAGTEGVLAERDWRVHVSIIWGSTNKAVVTITNSGPDTRLDGLTIGGGNAIHGGGISIVGAAPVVANCTIRNNITDGAGAGISIWGFYLVSSTEAYHPSLTNSVIVENQSINDEGDGGGIAVIGSSPFIAFNVIARNTAARNGGGIACWRHSSPTIANNIIEANSASYEELTASLGGGGIFASATDLDGRPIAFAVSAPLVCNNLIAANGGNAGGGITVVDSRLGAASIVNNTIVANNGAGIYWANTWPTNDNNVVAFNTAGFERGVAGSSDAVIRHNDVYGNEVLRARANYLGTVDRTGAEGNISADPRFANPAIGEYHLQPDSPCVDAGSASGLNAWPDLDREPRKQQVAVDMGADESNGTRWEIGTPVIHVTSRGDDTDGLSWGTAKRTISGGIAAAAQAGGEVWVAEGTYTEQVLPVVFVHLYGGFAGTETNRCQRDPLLHPTVIDGGGLAPVVYYRNAGYRAATFDGFTVQGGGIYTGGNPFHPDLTNRFGGRGGGIYCRVSGPSIKSNVIRSNSLGSPFNSWESYGAGVYAHLSHAEITGNNFADNEVLTRGDGDGGGIYALQSMATIEANTFRQNHAVNGAAIYGNWSELRVVGNQVETNALYRHVPSVYMGSGDGALTFRFAPNLLLDGNTIRGNTAVFGGGVCLRSCYAARVHNNLIVGNLAFDYSGFGGGGEGGGLYCDMGVNATGSVVIANNTVVGNSAPPTFLGHFGGGIAITLFTNGVVLANNIIASNSSGIWRYPYLSYQAILRNNCLQNSNANYVNLEAGLGDLQADPQLVNLGGNDCHLLAASPCVDAGSSAYAPWWDIAGVARPLDGRNSGAAVSDIGAREFINSLADTDRDGMADLSEMIAGTSPINAGSVLKLEGAPDTNREQVVLRWPSVVGRSYTIEVQPSIGPGGTWELLEDSIPGSGSPLERRHPLAAGVRFYRIGVKTK